MFHTAPSLLLLALVALLALGGAKVPSADIDIAALSTNNIEALTLQGAEALDSLGYSVCGAGDVNKDGFDDIIVGANGALRESGRGATAGDQLGYSVSAAGDVNGDGYADVVAGGFAELVLATFVFSGSGAGFVIEGAAVNDNLGFSVSGAGDVNNDGFADVIVGAASADPKSRDGAGATADSAAQRAANRTAQLPAVWATFLSAQSSAYVATLDAA
ncbi:hypothetical protein B484DRAFT_405273 [Ochromonadaceae sp. CCMP2298]|nr:hypothetical protein B484DRAFT_405273 [Ochromonadaceae sp. CCMP2298]